MERDNTMRTIKRYSNRKLYDTTEKKYITLEGIAELIRGGQDVEVIENDTGEDLTAVTLSQIIFEQQKRGSATPRGFLTNVIRFGSASPLDLLRRSLDFSGNAFTMIEKEVERRLQELVEQGEVTQEQMRRLQADLMSRFNEGGRNKGREREEPLLARLNVPTHNDIQELGERIESLNTRLDELIAASRTHPDGKVSRESDAPLPPTEEEPERPA